jgi:hypothetical protein
MVFEWIAIALITAYAALVVLGHVLLISAIYKCARGDRPKGKFIQTIAELMTSWRLAIRRVSDAEGTLMNSNRCAAICGLGVAALALATLEQPNPISSNRVAKIVPVVSEASNLAPSDPEAAGTTRTSGLLDAEFFLGSVEFDWNPNAPGGVPGFGPPPRPARPLASIQLRQ